jgi:hypothetical protein
VAVAEEDLERVGGEGGEVVDREFLQGRDHRLRFSRCPGREGVGLVRPSGGVHREDPPDCHPLPSEILLDPFFQFPFFQGAETVEEGIIVTGAIKRMKSWKRLTVPQQISQAAGPKTGKSRITAARTADPITMARIITR